MRLAILATFALACVPVYAQTSKEQEPALAQIRGKDQGFVELFTGKDLSGWVNVTCAPSTFTVAKDELGGPIIHCTGKPTGILRSAGHYENFVFEMEWRHLDKEGNSGLFVWSDDLTAPGVPFSRSVEIQIMTGMEGNGYTSDGDVFPIHGASMTALTGPGTPKPGRAFPTAKKMNPSPMWNHYRVECRNGELTLSVNGEVVTKGKDVSPRKGAICLESEGSPIDFRNIRIKELPAATPALAPEQVATPSDGFVPLYNGQDLSGWKVTPETDGHWKAEDWRLTFDGQGTHLWTEKSYKDFVLIADWRWTRKPVEVEHPAILPSGDYKKDDKGQEVKDKLMEAGDSGIYLRGNDKSQVNIWCWPIGSGEVWGYRTDPKMSAEVRAACTPKVCADKPIGQWNRFVITMKGDRLTVVLNGKTVIEHAQLPGVPAEGPIALQKHGDPIEFGNLMIKELK